MFSRTLTAVTAFGTATLLSTAAFANCGPAGCSTWSGGHNLHGSSVSHSSNQLAGGHSFSTPSYSSTSSHTSSFGGVANCPTGTTPQSDGTCLAGSSFGSSFGSSSSLSSSSSFSSGSSYDAGSINSQLSNIGSSTTYSSPSSSYVSSSAPVYSASSTSYSSAPVYSSGQEYNGVSVPPLSQRFASSSSSDNSYTLSSFSTGDSAPLSSSYKLAGLGASESLTPTSCPVAVHNPAGARVLGCYSVSRPKPKTVTHYTRVVRPVIYVRYPVPTAVPYTVNVPYAVPATYTNNCGVRKAIKGNNSRYGDFNNSGFGNGFQRGCGY